MLMEIESDSGSERCFSEDEDSLTLADIQGKGSQSKWGRKSVEFKEKPGKMFNCEYCRRSYKSRSQILGHILWHLRKKSASKKWTCDDCGGNFASENSLSRHRKMFPGFHYFPCGECGTLFLKENALKKHEMIQHPLPPVKRALTASQPHTCSHCGLVFDNEDDLQVHSAEVHGQFSASGRKFSCSFCEKTFISEEGLRYHEMHKHVNEDVSGIKIKKKNVTTAEFVCKECSATFPLKSSLTTHLKTHKKEKSRGEGYTCLICPRTFSSSDGIKYHLATHTGERLYSCVVCEKRFIKKAHLAEHLASHSNFKYFTCDRCPRRFNTHNAFKKHVKMFPGPHNFFCSKCGKIFMKESMLEKHLCVDLHSIALAPEVVAQLSDEMVEEYLCLAEEANQAEDREGSKLCYKCFKIFPSEESLTEHQHEHIGKQNYQCRFCPETFQRTDAFGAHIVDHLGKTPYMCRHCKRKFISPFTLANHLKAYPDKHSFNCLQCKRWFPSSDRLDKHDCIMHGVDVFVCACSKTFDNWQAFSQHFNSKPWKCCTCNQEYLTLSTLTKHVRSHTGVRPFICGHCGSAFSNKGRFVKHIKSHEKPALKCTVCDFTTVHPRRLNYHLARKHDMVYSNGSDSLCPVCGVVFPDLNATKEHIASEHKNSVTIEDQNLRNPGELCTLCGKMLYDAHSLKSHVLTVHKNVSCATCGETFGSRKELKSHMKSSHDRPTYTCASCGKMYSTSSGLRKHEKGHSIEKADKPFVCDKCGKLFKVSSSLKYHAKICGKPKVAEKQAKNPGNHSLETTPGQVYEVQQLYVC